MLNIIVNLTSSSGAGAKIWHQTEEILKNKNIEYKMFNTTKDVSAKDLAANITSDDENKVIVVIGGDGTLNEVFNGIKDYSKVTVGYIPCGTGGDFARDLGISHDPMTALETILHPKEFKLMDVGHLENNELTKNFAVSCGIGFDASVGLATGRSTIKNYLNKIGLASISYTVIALKKLIHMQKVGCTVILDDVRHYHYDSLIFVATMVHRYEGGGFMFCPDAVCDDGYIDVCVAGNISKPKILCIIPTAYTGKHTKFKGIDIFRAKKVQVIADTPLEIHTDGEYGGVQKEMTVSLCDKKVRVIVR